MPASLSRGHRRMTLKRLAAGAAFLMVLAWAALALALRVRPDPAAWDAYRMAGGALNDSAATRGLTVTFLGVSTLLFEDGETAIMTDGFFSRPGLLSVATRIRPDTGRIAAALRRAGVSRLAAVIPVHSHYDHAMDAPFVAMRTGAVLVGSASTANVGRGAGMPEERIRLARTGEAMTFGRFRVTLLRAEHVPSPFLMPGEIVEPLSPPARTKDYRLGECYSVVVEHDGSTLLVQGSAGFVAGALRDVRADVVYLGVATLGRQEERYRDAFWREVVGAAGARRVVAIHWDDFLRPLDRPLVPMPRLMDDFGSSMRFLSARSEAEGVDLRIPVEFVRTDPFAGLSRP